MILRKTVRFLSLLLSALSAGVLFGTKTSLGPSTKAFAPGTYVEVQQATIRNLRPVMGSLLPGAVLAILAEVALSARGKRPLAFALTLAGFLSQLASLVVTGLFELPINSRVVTWSRGPAGGLGEREGPLGRLSHREDRDLDPRAGVFGGRLTGVLGKSRSRLGSKLAQTCKHWRASDDGLPTRESLILRTSPSPKVDE